jgi:hypothetical protein
MARACGMHEGNKKCIQNFTWKTWRVKLFQGHRCGWEDNIKMVPKEIGCGSMDWIHLVQDINKSWAVVDTAVIMKLCVS